MNNQPIHTFHIPVMGLAFTIDSPIKVARFGISSVISIIEDSLVEKMREHYYRWINEEYKPIKVTDNDYRASRVTDYLNLVNRIVQEQFETLKKSAFEKGSEIEKYFEMLPETSHLKSLYLKMKATSDNFHKMELQEELRKFMRPGSIDVNIMTKVDKNNYDENGELLVNGSDAISAFRGYANSTLKDSSVVFSAGMNPRLFNYLEQFSEFTELNNGEFNKKIVIKVSDYRSAQIQGRYLARKGLWVSEFRIESGLNCGGHAFATEGHLMGPILEELKNKRKELHEELFKEYTDALTKNGKQAPSKMLEQKLSIQGGIGTYNEDKLLREYYGADATGWGSPFLLVPEATTVDPDTLQKLCDSTEKDLELSYCSPLGVRFNYLKNCSGEIEKLERIKQGKPGSPCTERMLALNTELSETPICTASIPYQRLKIAQLKTMNLSEAEYQHQLDLLYAKECLCIGLTSSAMINYNLAPITTNTLAVTVCPGPNIAYFSKVASLKEMVDHIYGRENQPLTENRPNFLIKELQMYLDYLDEQVREMPINADEKTKKRQKAFCENLLEGINYYHSIIDTLIKDSSISKETITAQLNDAEKHIANVMTVIAGK